MPLSGEIPNRLIKERDRKDKILKIPLLQGES